MVLTNNFDFDATTVFKQFIKEDIPRLARLVFRIDEPSAAQAAHKKYKELSTSSKG